MTDDPSPASQGLRPASPGAAPNRPRLSLLSRLFRARHRHRNGEGTVRETIEELITESGEDDRPVDDHERLILSNVIEMRELTADDVMVPRADIIAVEVSTPLAEVAQVMARNGHSRLPVYRNDLDQALGLVHIKDVIASVMARNETRPLADLIRPVLFVAPSMRAFDLLLEMRLKRHHMALVVDEYGGIDGLITIEDLVEEIVGDIQDEHDTGRDPEIIACPDGTLEADARLPLDLFEERVGPVLTEEERDEVDTLGGLVFRLSGHVPGRGALVAHASGIEFQVLDADPRRIRRLKIRNVPAPRAPAEPEPAA